MVNNNGILSDNEATLALNRGLLYGDGVFETVKIVDGKILYFEDHYFRLMSAMRIIRMQIPMEFTMEFLSDQIIATAISAGCLTSGRARLTVYRNEGGFYLPTSSDVSFIITASALDNQMYEIAGINYEVDLYKDFYVTKHLLSSIKTTNRLINITGSIYAEENGLDNCLLLNEQKNVVEALNGNLFMITGNKIVTPPISEGCLNGVMRKQIQQECIKLSEFEVLEQPISPFDLQKADELFVTNVIVGIRPVTRYRKKDFTNVVAAKILNQLNAAIRLG